MNPEIKKVDNLHNFASPTSEESLRLETSEVETENSIQDQIEETNPELIDDLHKETKTPTEDDTASNTGRDQSIKSFFDLNRLTNDVRYRNNFLSASNAFLHAFATVTNFIAKNNPALKVLNHVVDKSAFFCTRWLTPFISYGHAAYTAASKQKEPLLALIKLIPPAVFPLVGDANIDMVYGTSTALNQPYDNLINRITERIEKSSDYAEKMQKARKNPLEFISVVGKEFKSFVGDFLNGKSNFWKEGIYVINCSMMLLGSLPMLLFARDQRDTTLAKVSGVLRNLGGTLGDIGWVFGGKVEKEKVIMGIVYTIAQFADIAKRFVSEDVARVLIHLSAALNVSAMTVWNTLNTENAKKTIDELIDDKVNEQKSEENLVKLAKNTQELNKETQAMQLAA